MTKRTNKTKPDADAVAAADACLGCGERRTDHLVWDDDDAVRCTTCNTMYAPTGTPQIDAIQRVELIADAQRQIAAILEEAARKVQTLNARVAMHERAIQGDLKARRADARAIAKALAEHGVRTGDLNSRLVDAIQTCGERVYPTPYTPIASKWALIENRD